MTDIALNLDDVREALTYISPDLPYTEWAQIGRSLYSEFGDNAKDEFLLWCQGSSSYSKNKKSVISQWKNFSNTTNTSIGSFIRKAKENGWTRRKVELTAEEKKKYLKQLQEKKKEAEKRRFIAEEKQLENIKNIDEKEFYSYEKYQSGSPYFSQKNMEDIAKLIDVRRGIDKFGKYFSAWPLWSELGNTGKFLGYERILDKKVKIGDRLLNKFSSDNAKTNIGFATLGCNRGYNLPKRVFVVGGFADLYAAHVCTGECVITPIGESNITRVIETLSKKHPEIEFIAAPDNDKTGRQIASEASVYSSLPSVEGRDWSDVFINEGREAVKSQLLSIKGFDHVKSNTRYLSACIREGLNLLKSGMGTGKTTVVKQFIADNPNAKTLVISHRRELAKSLAADMKECDESKDEACVKYYEDLKLPSGHGLDPNFALKDAKRLVISIDSLWRLQGSTWDVLFFDEIEQGLSHFYAETNRHAESCLNMLRFLMTHSTTQIFADAHLGKLTMNFCRKAGLEKGVLFDNSYKIGQGKKVFIYESKTHLTETLLQQLMSKKTRYVYANSKAEIKSLATALEQESERDNYHGKSLVVHADVDDVEVTNALNDISAAAPEIDVIMASPTLGTGFNIEKYNPEKNRGHKFSATFGFLNSRVGTAEEGHQGLQRARDVSEFHVWIDPAERNESTDADYIAQKLVEEVSYETMKVLSIDSETGKAITKNPFFEWLYAEVKAHNNKSSNNYKKRWLELAIEQGYEIVTVSKNVLKAKLGEGVRQEAKERNERLELKDIQNTPVLVGDDFDNMMANGEFYSSIQITKSQIFKDLNLEIANDDEYDLLFPMANEVYNDFLLPGANYSFNKKDDAPIEKPQCVQSAVINALTFNQNKNRFVNRVKKLSILNLTRDATLALDANNIKYAESRIGWRHLSIKQKHLSRMLSIVGIDSDLNYNGKTWYKADVVNSLSNWLRKTQTQDSLLKYSGVTVSQSALTDPLQWLHNYLRSHGVPVASLGQKRVNSKQVHEYGVDVEKWEQVTTLVKLRNQGIEKHLSELDTELNEPQKIDNSVTPYPSVINNQIGYGVTASIESKPSDIAALQNTEGREKHPDLAPNSQTVSNENKYQWVNKLVDLAVSKIGLPEDKIRTLIKSEGEQAWEADLAAKSSSLNAWCLTIRDIFLEQYGNDIGYEEICRIKNFSFNN